MAKSILFSDKEIKAKDLVEQLINLPEDTIIKIVDPMEWKKENKTSWFNVEKIVYHKDSNIVTLL